MIYVGLTGWGDHYSLYPPGTRQGEKLEAYSGHFPTVEVDASFYAVQPQKNYEKWIAQTPESFRFVVKAYQGMTGHNRGKDDHYSSKNDMYSAYLESLKPLEESGKLAMILCQFPPWFDCRKEHVALLRDMKERLGDRPAALEFRHHSWFFPQFREQTLTFMEEEGWIHTVCDEPQVGEKSVPIVLHVTNSKKTLVRLHGRNVGAWKYPAAGENWRETRYLYHYNKDELNQWVQYGKEIEKQCKDVYILFNNNSGGDAAPNAKTFMDLANIEYTGLSPRQLNLFDDM